MGTDYALFLVAIILILWISLGYSRFLTTSVNSEKYYEGNINRDSKFYSIGTYESPANKFYAKAAKPEWWVPS